MAPDNFPFGIFWKPEMDFADYVAGLDANRRLTAPVGDLVPSSFLLATVDDVLVGRVSIRFTLNEFLATIGGHIGYCVLPDHRRQGHATEILRQGVIIARANGVDQVLVTCDDDNVGSAAVIERCGGVYESSVPSDESDQPKRRYWIG